MKPITLAIDSVSARGARDPRVKKPIEDYLRCPDVLPHVGVSGALSKQPVFLRVNSSVGYGRVAEPSGNSASREPVDFSEMRWGQGETAFPFDLQETVENLRFERYASCDAGPGWRRTGRRLLQGGYYLLRPLLPVSVRKHAQRVALRGWRNLRSPRWPVDTSVEGILSWALRGLMQVGGVTEVPFVWYWPEGYKGCTILTHDIETWAGRDFSEELMALDKSLGFPSSFGVVPEGRYEVPPGLIDSLRSGGAEIYVHGLNHDGRLFRDRGEFERRARRINSHGRALGAKGFRSPVLYRNLSWLRELEFSYDMSVPNVGHLDPQRGGCCTVMPFFAGELVEIPLTTTQDYSLFNILKTTSLSLWKRQLATILKRNGLASFNVHPDYVRAPKHLTVYRCLLEHLSDLCRARRVWIARSGEVAEWWRQRSEMQVVQAGGGWRVVGPGNERARVGFARLREGRVVYEVDDG